MSHGRCLVKHLEIFLSHGVRLQATFHEKATTVEAEVKMDMETLLPGDRGTENLTCPGRGLPRATS